MAVPEVRSVLAEIGLVSLVLCSSPGYFISTGRFSKQAKQHSTEPEMLFFSTRWGWLWRAQPIIVLEQNTPSYTTASGSATFLVRVRVVRGRVQVHLKTKRLHSLDLPLVFIIQVSELCELVSFVRCVSLLLAWYLPCFSQNQRRQGLQILGMFLTRLPILSILLNSNVSILVYSFVFFLQEQPRSSFWSLWYLSLIHISEPTRPP